MNTGYVDSLPVSQISTDARATFITRTYMHLLGAVAAFVAIEVVLFKTGMAESIARFFSGFSWLLVLGAFMVVGWIASRMAYSASSRASQYMGLAMFVVAEAIIFVPMLYMAMSFQPSAINNAAQVTLLGFGVLTIIAFMTRKDFSFLRTVLYWGGFVALGVIVVALLFGLQLGNFFSIAMIAFAGAAILYDTSNVIHHFPEDRYVGAALQLFSSVALMFWYVLSLFLSRD